MCMQMNLYVLMGVGLAAFAKGNAGLERRISAKWDHNFMRMNGDLETVKTRVMDKYDFS